MSKWSHLANAKYIDRIIAHAKANPTAWAAWRVAYDAAYEAAYEAAWRVARGVARGVVKVIRRRAHQPRDATLWDFQGCPVAEPNGSHDVIRIVFDSTFSSKCESAVMLRMFCMPCMLGERPSICHGFP